MIQGRIIANGVENDRPYIISKKVFIDELGYGSDFLDDGKETMSQYVVAQLGDDYVASGRVTFDGETYEISHVSVLKEYRNLKYGDFVVKILANKVFMNGGDEVSLLAINNTEKFFEKIGFKTVKEINNIPYMIATVELMDSCKKCKHN